MTHRVTATYQVRCQTLEKDSSPALSNHLSATRKLEALVEPTENPRRGQCTVMTGGHIHSFLLAQINPVYE